MIYSLRNDPLKCGDTTSYSQIFKSFQTIFFVEISYFYIGAAATFKPLHLQFWDSAPKPLCQEWKGFKKSKNFKNYFIVLRGSIDLRICKAHLIHWF